MELSDQECVEGCRAGHVQEFEILVARYQKPLFAYLIRRLGNPSQAEEAAQEAFVRAFQGLGSLRKPGLFHSWLIGIAARLLKEQFRLAERQERGREAAGTLWGEAPGSQSDYPVEEAIAELPESYRQVILLRYYEGLSCQETATRLEVPLGTVTKMLSRAYEKLRQELQARESMDETINTRTQNELR